MEMSGEQRIAAPREAVWAALNDPEILRACIPGCQELERRADDRMTAVAQIKVGPVSAKFRGAVTLSDIDPPNGYRIAGEGQGGVAGFARGSADVRLEPDGAGTLLRYAVTAQVGGKLSQLGGRLIDATARKMSDAFFARFAAEVAEKPAAEAPAPVGEPGGAPAEADRGEAADAAPAPQPIPAPPPAPSPPPMSAPPASASPPARTPPAPTPRPAAPAEGGPGWAPWLNAAVLVVALLVLGWSLSGGARPAAPAGAVSAEFAAGVQVALIAAVGYLLGRQHGAARDGALVRQLLVALAAERRGGSEP